MDRLELQRATRDAVKAARMRVAELRSNIDFTTSPRAAKTPANEGGIADAVATHLRANATREAVERQAISRLDDAIKRRETAETDVAAALRDLARDVMNVEAMVRERHSGEEDAQIMGGSVEEELLRHEESMARAERRLEDAQRRLQALQPGKMMM